MLIRKRNIFLKPLFKDKTAIHLLKSPFCWLQKPFPLFQEKQHNWVVIISISLFIAVFLLLFQPFGLHDIQIKNRHLFIAGYGAVTFFILFVLLFIIPRFFIRIM